MLFNTNVCTCVLRHVRFFVTPLTVARQAPHSMGFSRQECWSGLPFPTPGDLPTQGLKLCLWHPLRWQANSLSLVLPISNPERRCCESAALSMPANLENSAVATGLEKLFSFQSQRKAMPKNVQTTTQMHSFHTLTK